LTLSRSIIGIAASQEVLAYSSVIHSPVETGAAANKPLASANRDASRLNYEISKRIDRLAGRAQTFVQFVASPIYPRSSSPLIPREFLIS
jgi:hypothetical protein